MTATLQTASPRKSTGASISIDAVSKKYGDNTVLEAVDLDIRAGEFLTLLGASGSGKSTLLNIIAGFIRPNSGTVKVDGRDITSLPPHKRGFGMVFQHYALFPHMSVADNVAFPLKRQKVAKNEIRTRVAEALEMVELGHLGNRRPAELSGGQQQRVALARAIVFRPRVLLMDEPLGALDKLLREQLQLEIRRLHQEMGITFVFVTHDQDEALMMSDRIALLRNGRIVQLGTPEQLYAEPNCRYSAEFVGASNIFTGTIQANGFIDDADGQHYRIPEGADRDGRSLMIRPERLHIATETAFVPESMNRVEAIVEDCIYLGSSRTVQLRTPAGRRLLARTDVPRVPDGVVPGARVYAYWDVHDSRVLD
ncbi:ABC transporter ATP-binding protein [Thermomonospora curvata]|uniref:Spermidine/putrescine import ATP-binding protein PotA n=1 Tax=Thermomonospora curvata (strain ATCC 19995 / DSM 43183 / JCM 3096 / KCTC 9072 / NBRC 15933 / NCIMB 10081 / Henssen B9) TaxID=471852 RepID=D1A2M7_THECD|nr:ABC transporter ATP-binding protein [Thermomonospora curvata]ACY96047.1 spermidine/putrescine ABC transporter ATPase subunit [Thermomonospora curvata DSM 43183]